MRRNYTEKEKIEYNVTKKKNKEMRELAPKSGDNFKNYGITGKAAGVITNKIIEKPIQKIAYCCAEKKYDPNRDSPAKGSNLYNHYYFKFKKIAKWIVGLVVALVTGGSVIAFIFADLIGKIRIGCGGALVILLFSVIKWAIGKLFK